MVRISKLVLRLLKMWFKYGNQDVYVMVEITDPVRIQIEDPIIDTAWTGDRFVLIGPERLDSDYTEDA